jgi:hypothetical protein
VRDALLRKQERLVAALKAFAAREPREMLAVAAAKFAELERRLRVRAGSIEELDAQRRFIAELPGKVAPLAAVVEAAKVRRPAAALKRVQSKTLLAGLAGAAADCGALRPPCR